MWHAIFSVGFHIKRILKKFDSVLEILEIFVGFEINSIYKKKSLETADVLAFRKTWTGLF